MTDATLNPKSRGLGRGLNALFEDDEADYPQVGPDSPIQGRARTMLGIDQLEPGKGQPRRIFKQASLDELAESIKKHGILQPLLVRELGDLTGRYEIIAGERRWRAAQKAQLHEVPVIVLTISDIEAFEIALIENLQREDLDPIDEAYGYQKLMNEYGYTQEKLAEQLGKSRSHIANMTRLLNLPFMVQNYLSDGKISIGHARALIPAGENAEQLARDIIAKSLSVRETEKLAAEATGRAPGARKSEGGKSSPKAKDVNTLALEKDLTDLLGMRVSIQERGEGAGEISVEYKSLDQLDDLCHRLTKFPDAHDGG
jgi:ParB family transcriptional regulator, chromosome partitioning protein